MQDKIKRIKEYPGQHNHYYPLFRKTVSIRSWGECKESKRKANKGKSEKHVLFASLGNLPDEKESEYLSQVINKLWRCFNSVERSIIPGSYPWLLLVFFSDSFCYILPQRNSHYLIHLFCFTSKIYPQSIRWTFITTAAVWLQPSVSLPWKYCLFVF